MSRRDEDRMPNWVKRWPYDKLAVESAKIVLKVDEHEWRDHLAYLATCWSIAKMNPMDTLVWSEYSRHVDLMVFLYHSR